MSTSPSKSINTPKGLEAESRILAKTTVRPGDIYGRYQLLVPVAAGGMGTVWAARQLGHPQFKRLVALKIAHDNLTLDEEYRKMFLDEARLASSVQHPNVCSVVDMGEEDGRLFLVMEWMAGSVRELVGKVPKRVLAPNVAVRIIADACAGLHSAHELHDEKGEPIELIHRDISPDNILFSLDGRVKVTDFGIARARDQMHKKTETGEMKGKISYMAPEQIKSKNYDRRVDIFALGCVLYRATVGKKAFDGSSATVIYDILESRFARPHEVNPNFDPGLEDIMLCAMSLEPDDRYPTAEAMRVALEEWLVKNGSASTSSAEVGAVVRQTLGIALAERSERIRVATADLDNATSGAKSTNIPITVEEATSLGQSSSELKRADAHAVSGETPMTTAALSTPAKSRRWISLAVPGFLFASALGAYALSRRPAAPAVHADVSSGTPSALTAPTHDAPAASSTASAGGPAAAASVTLAVRSTTGNAVLVLDDAAPTALPFRRDFPRDGSKHQLKIDAPGFRPELRTVTFDESADLSITLRPIERAQGAAIAPPPVHTNPPSSAAPVVTTAPQTNVAPAATPTTSGKKKRTIDRDLGE